MASISLVTRLRVVVPTGDYLIYSPIHLPSITSTNDLTIYFLDVGGHEVGTSGSLRSAPHPYMLYHNISGADFPGDIVITSWTRASANSRPRSRDDLDIQLNGSAPEWILTAPRAKDASGNPIESETVVLSVLLAPRI
jgi:hypothetical protein